MRSYLEEISPASLISDTNPKIIDNNISGSSVSDFTFPLGEVCNILSIGASHVFFNDDNERFLNLAKRLRKRVLRRLDGSIIVRPTLYPGNVKRLYGYNYLKMSKSNGNAIRLGVSDEEIRNGVKKLASRKWLMRQGAKYRIALKMDQSSERLPDHFPLDVFSRAFLSDTKRLRCQADEIRSAEDTCTSYALKLNAQIRNSIGDLEKDRQDSLEELRNDEKIVRSRISIRMKELFVSVVSIPPMRRNSMAAAD